MKRWKLAGALGACAVLALVGSLILVARQSYQVRLVVPSAAQVVVGAQARVGGTHVGQVSGLEARDDKAIVTVDITDDNYVPLHEGTTSSIDWQSVLGERIVTIKPGPASNAALPNGALYEAQSSQVEADQVLAALDAPTRHRLSSLIQGLRTTTQGHEPSIQATLRTAGPAVDALAQILAAVGRDGPALKSVATQLHQVTAGLAGRQDHLSGTVNNLRGFTGGVGGQAQQLRAGLAELPSTLDAARDTLDKAPPAAAAAKPLLRDLRPATSRLPAVAKDLEPTLRDLSPTLDQLRPTLRSLQPLLNTAPGMLDASHATLPPAATALKQLGPAAEFLRPYTPELNSFVTGFGATFSSYDAQGHGWAVSAVPGAASAGEQPGKPPLVSVDRRPAPGSSVGQPWTDANGSEIR